MSSLLAVDWGTSSFRLMHLGADGDLINQISSSKGISKLSVEEMEPYLLEQINTLNPELLSSPIIMCGMIGSAIGWQEVAYAPCPTDPSGLASQLERLNVESVNAYIVPGLNTVSPLGLPDVMRGEETQVVGWLAQASEADKKDSILCLPGTHAKWVQISEGKVENFNTALTGELFAVLKENSILARGEQEQNDAAFALGLEASKKSPALAHLLFSTRAGMLAGNFKAEHSASYLSGLVIGSDVGGALAAIETDTVHLIGGSALAALYEKAIEAYGAKVEILEGDVASAKGLFQLYQASGK